LTAADKGVLHTDTGIELAHVQRGVGIRFNVAGKKDLDDRDISWKSEMRFIARVSLSVSSTLP
jgi:hypothetical protein